MESFLAEISYSPLHVIDASSPPVITIHGMDDSVVRTIRRWALQERLDASGIGNEPLSLPGGKHAGFTCDQVQQAFTAMLAFVDYSGGHLGPRLGDWNRSRTASEVPFL